jgi:hypothetical protein
MTVPYETADVAEHVRRQADTLVRAVNPGRDYSGGWFAPKAAEVTEAMIRKLCLGLTGQGPKTWRKIRITRERSQR